MYIIPAIDLKDGEAVRLTKGMMNSAKIYSSDLAKLASEFESLGAKWLHIVDLNGAFEGRPINLDAIKKVRESCNMKLELGGGIRDEETIKRYLDIGIDRVILGSIALKEIELVKNLSKKYPIVIGIDAKDGYVATHGWAKDGKVRALDLAKEYAFSDIEAIICTDISKDGTLEGVNVDFTQEIAKASQKPTIASGGVRDMEDIKALKESGNVEAVIIGKAFYEGTLNLVEAFNFLNN